MMRLLIVFYSSSLCYSSCLCYSIFPPRQQNLSLFVRPICSLSSFFLLFSFVLSVWFDMVWFGLAWIGLAWFGLWLCCVAHFIPLHTFSSLPPLILRHTSITPHATLHSLCDLVRPLFLNYRPQGVTSLVPHLHPCQLPSSQDLVTLRRGLTGKYSAWLWVVLQVDRETVI